ncbi:MAG: TIGR03960 family B12-binding radical SAM protein [Candidatus Omnitrophica bacterium]|nr:TIGR03960 family B12-binding radical SAM protein [Candidatus Omnitrophota bacterium]
MNLDEDILLKVNKPARYIGKEWNTPKKDFDSSYIKFALCFPDLYEVGMSNLGFRIIYSILNNLPDVSCERFFSPHIDMEKILRRNSREIFSLETQRRLRDFDIIGFCLGYELNYTNVLNILDLGKIPLESCERDYNYPLVVGGGSCVLNPEPMHEFFDLFVIGEAEEAILEIVDIYRKYKHRLTNRKIDKQDLLIMLSKIEGVYVPCLYEVSYTSEGNIASFRPKDPDVPCKVKKRFIRDLDQVYYPLDWLVPYTQIIHDRINVEIMRGCPNVCSFCQARFQYFPFRIRDTNSILSIAQEIYNRTGYEEISLGGLSVCDYPNILDLVKLLVSNFKEKGVSISLPSIRPRDAVGKISDVIATFKKTGLTFAPESASEELRRKINKHFDVQKFFATIEKAYQLGYQHIKLYFMIGLPGERQADLDNIIDFSYTTSELRRKVNKKPAQVNISINTFIPKPHTPLQWLRMEDIDIIKSKQHYLKMRAGALKNLRLSFHNPYMSFLEGVLSRGDRRLGKVILHVFQRGARFDAWDNCFVFDIWEDGFRELNVRPEIYLKEKSPDKILPWDFLEIGTDRERLVLEYNKLLI